MEELQDYILRKTGLKPYEPGSPMNIGYGVAAPGYEEEVHNYNILQRLEETEKKESNNNIEVSGSPTIQPRQLTAEQQHFDQQFSLPGLATQFQYGDEAAITLSLQENQLLAADARRQIQLQPVEKSTEGIARNLAIEEEQKEIQTITGQDASTLFQPKFDNSAIQNLQEEQFQQQVAAVNHKLALKKAGARSQMLDDRILTSYFDDVQSYGDDSTIKKLLIEKYGEDYTKASPEMQNKLLKLLIVDEIYSSSSDLEAFQTWNSIKSKISANDEKLLDGLYARWYMTQGKKKFADVAYVKDQLWKLPITQRGEMKSGKEGEEQMLNVYSGRLGLPRLEQKLMPYIQEASKQLAEKYKEGLLTASDEDRKLAIDQFQHYSKQLSNKYKKFEGTEYLPLKEQDYLNLMTQFQADSSFGGEEYAARQLQEKYNNIIAKHTSWVENAGAWASSFASTFSADLAKMNASWGAYVLKLAMPWRSVSDIRESIETGAEIIQYNNSVNVLKARELGINYAEGRAPENDFYADVNTAYGKFVDATAPLADSAGSIAAFVAQGYLVSNVVGKVASITTRGLAAAGTATGVITNANKSKKLFKLARTMQKGSAATQTLLFANMNANLESTAMYQGFIHQKSLEYQNLINQNFERDLAEDIRANPAAYADLYYAETGIPLGTLESHSTDGLMSASKIYSSKDIERLTLHFSENEALRQEYFDSVKGAYDGYMKNVETAAQTGATMTHILNFAPEVVINATLRKSLLSKSFRRGIAQADAKLAEKLSIVFEKGKWTAKAVPFTKKMKAVEYLSNALGETTDEYGEEIFSSAGTAAAEAMLTRAIQEKYGNYQMTSFAYQDLADAIAAGLSEIPNAAVSREAAVSGIYGGVTSLLGMPAINPNVNWSQRKQGESWLNYAKRLNPVSWNSIFTLPFSDASIAEENKQRQAIADYVSLFLSDPSKQKLFENAGYMASMMNKLNVAAATGNKKAIDDAHFDVVESAVAHLSLLQGTDYYDVTVSTIENRTQFREENLADPESAESKAVQEYYAEIESDKTLSKEEVLKTIIKDAKGMMSMLQQASQEYADIVSAYGEDIDPDFAQSMVKNRLLARDRELRLQELQTTVDATLKDVNYTGEARSKLSEKGKKFAAKYGTGYSRDAEGNRVYAVDKVLSQEKQKAAAKIAAIEADKSLTERQKQKAINKINKALAQQEKEAAEFKQELETLSAADVTLSAEDILAMDPIDRALFLSRDDYSMQQKQEINKLAKVKQQLITMGELQAELDQARAIDSQMALDPKYLEDVCRKAREQARQEIVKSKYAYLADSNLTYEDFRKKYFEAYNAIESESELVSLTSIIEDSPHAEQFKAERQVFEKVYNQIHDSEKYQQLSKSKDKTKAVHLNALLYYMEEAGLGINYADDINTIEGKISKIDPKEFSKYVERQANGEPVGTLTNEELAQILKSTYDSVNKELDEIRKRNEEHKNVSSENVDNNPDTSVSEKEETPTPEPTETSEALPQRDFSNAATFSQEQVENLQQQAGQEAGPKETEGTPEQDKGVEEAEEKTEENTTEGDSPKPEEATQGKPVKGEKPKPTAKEATYDDMSEAVSDYIEANGLAKHKVVKEQDLRKVYTWFKNTLLTFKTSGQNTETPWGYLQMKASAISNKVLRAAVEKVMVDIESSFAKVETQSEPVESAPVDITIEGHTGKTKEYMQKHRSYERLATTSATRGSAVRFYTPQELIEDGQPTPVVAVVEDPKGHITIDGKKYGAVGMVPMTPTMQRENPKGKGNFVYSQKSIIDSFEKEAFQPEHYERNTPVVATMAKTDSSILTAERAAKDFAQKVQIKDGKMIYSIPRGRMDTTVDAEVYVGKPKDVKSDGQHTIFDKAAEYNKISTDEQATEEQKDSAATSLLRYNGLVKKAAQALGRNFGNKNGTVGLQKVVETLAQDPTADVGAVMSEMWKKVNSSLEFAGKDHYTMVVKNVSKNEDGSVSFDVALASLWETIPLTSITNAKAGQKLSDQHYADVLLNLMYTPAKAGETERQLRYKNGKEAKGSWMQYNVMYKNAQGEKITENIKEAALAGVLISNHKDFKSRPAGLRVSLLRDNTPFTDDKGVSDMTDNAAPATTPSDTTTTTDGIKVDTDTGLAAEATPEPVQETEEVSAETTAEEIVEEAAQNIEDTYDEDFELPDYENIPDDTDDMDDDYEYQLIKARKTLISSVKDYFSTLIHSLEGKQAYTEIVAETKQQFQQDTKTNAFTFTTAREKKEARKNAEARAKAIRNMDLPHVKSVSVVSNGNKGYSISISYHDYSRYIRRRVAEVESMSTTALRETAAAFNDTKKALHPTQQEAENSKSFFSQFGNKSLKEQFQKKISEPISQKLDNLLTEILSSYNIKVIEKDLKAIHGNDIAGAINSAGDIIYLAKGGARNAVTLAEETAHVLISNIANGKHVDEDTKALYDNIAAGIESTSIYKETLDEYKDVYINEDTNEPDYDRIKQEAIGKALAVTLSNKYSTDNTLKAAMSDLANTIILKVKSLLEKSGLTNGKEAVLQYKLKQLATTLLDKDVKKVNKKNGDTLISSVLSSLGIDTKSKHKKSKKELQMEKDKKRIVERSSARTILYENLAEETKEIMSKKGITETSWKEFPMELQEQILKCLSKN